MFTIDVTFIGQKPPQRNYSIMNIDKVYEFLLWEAQLTISLNKQIIFSEEIAIVEFYWYFANWIKKRPVLSKAPFTYSTIEHEKPILSFLFQENNYWKIDSIWNRSTKPVLAAEQTFWSEICKLFHKLSLIMGEQQ